MKLSEITAEKIEEMGVEQLLEVNQILMVERDKLKQIQKIISDAINNKTIKEEIKKRYGADVEITIKPKGIESEEVVNGVESN